MSDFKKYRVAYNQMNRNVHILGEDQQETEGHKVIGEFEADVLNGEVKGEKDFQSDVPNVLIAKSKAILKDLGISDFQNVVYEDKASNAPRGGYVLSHKEREEAIREGIDPYEKGQEITENLEEAEEKYAAKPVKKQVKHKATKSTK